MADFQLIEQHNNNNNNNTRLMALCPGLPRSAGTRKVKPIWILLKQVTVSGSGISWSIRKYAPRSRQTTTPAPHHSVFYRPDAKINEERLQIAEISHSVRKSEWENRVMVSKILVVVSK